MSPVSCRPVLGLQTSQLSSPVPVGIYYSGLYGTGILQDLSRTETVIFDIPLSFGSEMAIQAPGSAAAARALCDPPDSDWIVISGVSGTNVHRGALAVEHIGC